MRHRGQARPGFLDCSVARQPDSYSGDAGLVTRSAWAGKHQIAEQRHKPHGSPSGFSHLGSDNITVRHRRSQSKGRHLDTSPAQSMQLSTRQLSRLARLFLLESEMDLTGLFHALTGSGQPQGLLGTGMAQQAAQVIQSRPYQLHVQEARAMGQQPMTPEQFAQAMAPQTRPNLGF